MIYYILMGILASIFFIMAWYLLSGRGSNILLQNQTNEKNKQFFKINGWIMLFFGVASCVLIFIDSKMIWYIFLILICLFIFQFARGITKRLS
ncbi:hypothetical protein [Isobaculum melis]|uniref:DUF3784 domain-containing protein n=1 Tax=Isobaculum melis TaxID=142588 RepID=A0A1H9RH78_9LACT|nr:hypothetical protein [Isobaculum melis]SER72062.1 hypothetical protein SAMN04488559_10435 [Isobaculum melis]